MAADPTYGPKVHGAGPDQLVLESGGVIDFLAGSEVRFGGTDKRAALDAVPSTVAAAVVGVAAGYKIARGIHRQVAAADTVVTGLATVVAVLVSFDDAPTVKQLFCSGTIGDQAGTPAAGSVILKTWKPTAVNDVTPTAATDFTDTIDLAWVAIGT